MKTNNTEKNNLKSDKLTTPAKEAYVKRVRIPRAKITSLKVKVVVE